MKVFKINEISGFEELESELIISACEDLRKAENGLKVRSESSFRRLQKAF